MTNRSAVLVKARELRIEDRADVTAGPGEVLVKVAAVGICGSDVHYFERGRIGKYVVDSPLVLGHESAGVIVSVGDGVEPRRVGQRVALEPGIPCRACAQCLAGRYNLCPQVRFFATPPVDGALAQFVAIDALFAHAVPEGLELSLAAMAEPVSVALWACQKAGVTAGDRVLVTGAGPIGLLAGQVARSFGASDVVITDVSEYRLGVASDLGLRSVAAGSDLPGEFDVLLECSGAEVALSRGMASMAPAGRVILVGMGADEVRLDVPLVQGREISVTGIFRYANTYPLALDLIAKKAIDVERLITHRFSLDDTEQALTLARRDPHSVKAMVLLEA